MCTWNFNFQWLIIEFNFCDIVDKTSNILHTFCISYENSLVGSWMKIRISKAFNLPDTLFMTSKQLSLQWIFLNRLHPMNTECPYVSTVDLRPIHPRFRLEYSKLIWGSFSYDWWWRHPSKYPAPHLAAEPSKYLAPHLEVSGATPRSIWRHPSKYLAPPLEVSGSTPRSRTLEVSVSTPWSRTLEISNFVALTSTHWVFFSPRPALEVF